MGALPLVRWGPFYMLAMRRARGMSMAGIVRILHADGRYRDSKIC